MKRLAFLLMFCSLSSFAIELGLSLQYLVPDLYPDFQIPVTAFGPRIGIPIGSNALELQAIYGGNNGGSETVSLYLLDTDYRINIPTPFLTAFVLGGIHYMHYGFLGNDHGFFGPFTGLGFDFPMAKDFLMGMAMKIYLSQKVMLTFGGSFAFIL